MQTLNNSQQRWIALGLFFSIILAVLALILIPWINTLNDINEEIDDLIFRVKRYERVIASRKDVQKKVEQGRKEITSLGYFSEHSSPSLAKAELQRKVKEIVQRAEGDLTSTQELPQKKENDLIRIALKLKIEGDMEMLRTLLYEIEQEKPLINIDVLTIVPKRGKRNRKTRLIEESGLSTVTLEISSYMRNKI